MARSEGGRLLREQHVRKIHFLCRRQRHKKLVEAVPAESVRRNGAERTQIEKLILSYHSQLRMMKQNFEISIKK